MRHRKSRDYIFFVGKGIKNHQLGTEFLVQDKIAPVFKRVEFVSDRMSHIFLRGRWCNVLNAHAPSEEKNDFSKDIFYKGVF
jgi:hypothetical protein